MEKKSRSQLEKNVEPKRTASEVGRDVPAHHNKVVL